MARSASADHHEEQAAAERAARRSTAGSHSGVAARGGRSAAGRVRGGGRVRRARVGSGWPEPVGSSATRPAASATVRISPGAPPRVSEPETSVPARLERDGLALRLVRQRHPHRAPGERGHRGRRPGHPVEPGVGVAAQRDHPPVGAGRGAGHQPGAEPAERPADRVRGRQRHLPDPHQRRRTDAVRRGLGAVDTGRTGVLGHHDRAAGRVDQQRLRVVRTVGVGQPVQPGLAVGAGAR